MATKQTSGQFVIDGAHTYVLGSGAHGRSGSSWLVHIENDDLADASIVVACRAAGSSFAFAPIPYVRLSLAGTASDGTVVSDAITDTAVIQIPVADGMDVALVVSDGGSLAGSAACLAVPSTL